MNDRIVPMPIIQLTGEVRVRYYPNLVYIFPTRANGKRYPTWVLTPTSMKAYIRHVLL